MNLLVWVTSVPPKRLEWKLMDWLHSASKLMVAKSYAAAISSLYMV